MWAALADLRASGGTAAEFEVKDALEFSKDAHMY